MCKSVAAGDAEVFDDQARITRWNDAMGGFLSDALRLRLSLDYIFCGVGEPFLPTESAA